MASVDVVVVPVSMRDDGGNRPVPYALVDDSGAWAWETNPRDPGATAMDLLAKLLPVPLESLNPSLLRPLGVTFFAGRPDGSGPGRVTLVYTAAVPVALADPSVTGAARWRALLAPTSTSDEASEVGRTMLIDHDMGEILESVLDFWRQSLEETASALMFLPEYWTMPQLRDIYSAVWGYEQDTAGFSRWANKGRDSAFGSAISDNVDLADVSAKMVLLLQGTNSAPNDERLGGSPSASGADRTRSGINYKWIVDELRKPAGRTPLVGLPLMGSAAAIVGALLPMSALAAAAALVAYQPNRQGKAPTWYRTVVSQPDDHRLERLYLPRPGWKRTPRSRVPDPVGSARRAE